MGERFDEDAVEHTLETLENLAGASRHALVTGQQFYFLDVDPLAVSSSYRFRDGDLDVICSIGWRGFVIGRALKEYTRKLAMNPLDFIQFTTRAAGPHIVLELGPGLGRSLQEMERASKSHPDLRHRNISFFGECDHFYFKLSALFKSLLNHEINETIERHFTPISSHEVEEIKKDFITILILYLTNDENFLYLLYCDIDAASRQVTEDHDLWKNLMDSISQGKIPNIHRDMSEEPYVPSAMLEKVLRDFVSEPGKFLEKLPPRPNRVYAHPKDRLGIASSNIILGGHMHDFITQIPDASLSTVLGVRSTVYIVRDPKHYRGIVPFGVQIAHKLRPGGGWLDDWPRANFDSDYHLREAIDLQLALMTDASLRHEVKIFLIWGPSEEYPDECLVVPVAMVMVKRDEYGQFPLKDITGSFITSLDSSNGTRNVHYQLVGVTPNVDNLFRTARNDALLTKRRHFSERIRRLLEHDATKVQRRTPSRSPSNS